MHVQIVSDFHLEFHKDGGDAFLKSLVPAADTLLLAGDFAPILFFRESLERFRKLTSKWKTVFYVPGNHELYGSSPYEVGSLLKGIEKELPNLKVLRPGRVEEIEGRRIVGATLWFRDDHLNGMYKSALSDFDTIKHFVPWVYEQNRTAIDFLRDWVEPGSIVVTHHLPSAKCVPNEYRNSALNRFFVCDMEWLMYEKRPALWAFGHTHSQVDIKIGDCRVIANPFGYVGEASTISFKDDLVVEV